MKFNIKYILYFLVSSSVLLMFSMFHMMKANSFLTSKIRSLTEDVLKLKLVNGIEDKKSEDTASDKKVEGENVKSEDKKSVVKSKESIVKPRISKLPIVKSQVDESSTRQVEESIKRVDETPVKQVEESIVKPPVEVMSINQDIEIVKQEPVIEQVLESVQEQVEQEIVQDIINEIEKPIVSSNKSIKKKKSTNLKA
jgi:hypothetical protein